MEPPPRRGAFRRHYQWHPGNVTHINGIVPGPQLVQPVRMADDAEGVCIDLLQMGLLALPRHEYVVEFTGVEPLFQPPGVPVGPRPRLFDVQPAVQPREVRDQELQRGGEETLGMRLVRPDPQRRAVQAGGQPQPLQPDGQAVMFPGGLAVPEDLGQGRLQCPARAGGEGTLLFPGLQEADLAADDTRQVPRKPGDRLLRASYRVRGGNRGALSQRIRQLGRSGRHLSQLSENLDRLVVYSARVSRHRRSSPPRTVPDHLSDLASLSRAGRPGPPGRAASRQSAGGGWRPSRSVQWSGRRRRPVLLGGRALITGSR